MTENSSKVLFFFEREAKKLSLKILKKNVYCSSSSDSSVIILERFGLDGEPIVWINEELSEIVWFCVEGERDRGVESPVPNWDIESCFDKRDKEEGDVWLKERDDSSEFLYSSTVEIGNGDVDICKLLFEDCFEIEIWIWESFKTFFEVSIFEEGVAEAEEFIKLFVDDCFEIDWISDLFGFSWRISFEGSFEDSGLEERLVGKSLKWFDKLSREGEHSILTIGVSLIIFIDSLFVFHFFSASCWYCLSFCNSFKISNHRSPLSSLIFWILFSNLLTWGLSVLSWTFFVGDREGLPIRGTLLLV